MKLRDFTGIAEWPPFPGGAYSPYQVFPVDESSVVLKEVFPVRNEFVTFTGEYEGQIYSYDLQAEDEAYAQELARWMGLHVGKNLSAFGDFPLDN